MLWELDLNRSPSLKQVGLAVPKAIYCQTMRVIRPTVRTRKRGIYKNTTGSDLRKLFPFSKNTSASLSSLLQHTMQIRNAIAVRIKATPSKIFHTLGVKNCTGLARMKMPANIIEIKTPTNASRMKGLGQQVTKAMQMIPRQSPNNKERRIKSIEFKIESLTAICGELHK